MTPKEADDVTYKLKEIFSIYGKEIEEQVCKLWLRSLAGLSPEAILRALNEYPKEGKYAPKPVDIIELASLHKAQNAHREPKPVFKEGDPLVARAWINYMRFAYCFDYRPSEQSMPIDQCLEIVNREAAKSGTKDAILPEHRISTVWARA